MPPRGDPLECRVEIWHQKTRIVALSEGEEIMTLTFFVLTQCRRVSDRRADTQIPALAQRRTGNKKAQLTLTNPRDAKACRKLRQFDVKTSCLQVNTC